MAKHLAAFQGQKYINLETYRKSGEPVRTPVWFVEMEGFLYAATKMDSGKVKRIRRDPKVKIAPCDVRGNPRGDWVEADAKIVEDRGLARRAERGIVRKYGPLAVLMGIVYVVRRHAPAVVVIRVQSDANLGSA